MDIGEKMVDIVITVDRTMMSNHHGKEFLGFGATGVPIVLPESLWLKIFAPKMKVVDGRPVQAPYGIRKIEAALLDAGYDVAVIDPDYLDTYLKDAKILMLSHHDYFGFGPPSSTFASIFKTEPLNARSFARMMESEPVRAAKKRGIKIIAGGPAVWQWDYREDMREKWGIDTVVDGEGEKIVVDLVKKVYNNEPLPKKVVMPLQDVPDINEISEIKHASVNGLVEVMRGCPRGCKFCSVTLRRLRYYPFDKIEREMLVNKKEGLKGVILHSDDLMLYGGNGVIPNGDKLVELHKLAKKHFKTLAWSHASVAGLLKAEQDSKAISRISEIFLQDQDWIGVEIGVETGSPRLANIIMPAKASPFDTQKWPEIVKEAAGLMSDTHIIPAMTLITGLPEETEDDVRKTIELVEDLWDFKALIMPMFFVPMGKLKEKDWFKANELSDIQIELLKVCMSHGLRQSKKILREYLRDTGALYPLYPVLRGFVGTLELLARKNKAIVRPDHTDLKSMHQKI